MSVFLEWAFHALVGKAGRLYWSRGVLMHSTQPGSLPNRDLPGKFSGMYFKCA